MADALTEDAPRPGRPGLALPTLAACAAAGLALVVVVGLQAPAVSVGLRWEPPERRFIPDTTKLELEELFIKPVELADNGLPAWAGWVLVTLVALAILYVLAQLIRRITRRTPAVNVARTGADSGVTSEAEARILQSGLAAAIQILASERNPGNAVVQAWQGLQDAAAEAGLHRRPAETASEFTARILYRSRRSAEPIAVLLSLYQRVRFGEHTPTADQIAAARDALGVLVDLWQADFPERRPPKVAR